MWKTNFFLNFFQVLNTGGQLTLRAAPQPPQQQQNPQQQQPNNRIMTQQQQQYDQYQQQQQQQQNPVYQQPHQHHSANELYDMYDEYATGKIPLISRKIVCCLFTISFPSTLQVLIPTAIITVTVATTSINNSLLHNITRTWTDD